MSYLTGERTKDSPHLLQGQGLQEAHPAQGHPVQGWKGMIRLFLEWREEEALLSSSLVILLHNIDALL